MIAAKAMDPVVGIDIHIIQPPGPVPPVPIPHPFVGMLFDPMDFAPVIGATVLVNGMPRATAGTGAKAVPPHIPIGGVFVKGPPASEGDVFMGSSTVLADDDPLSFLGMPVLTCHDIGMPPIPRLKKKRKPTSLELPTSVLLAVPMGRPVLVGGPPTISMMALGMKAAMAALGGALAKVRKAQKASRKAKAVSDRIQAAAKKAMDKLGVPPGIQNRVARGICTVTGHPVDVATGRVFTEAVDLVLGGPLPLRWERAWDSSSTYDGPLGRGWHHAYDAALVVEGDGVAVRLPDGRPVGFPALAPGGSAANEAEGLTLTRDAVDVAGGYALRTAAGDVYRFARAGRGEEHSLVRLEGAGGGWLAFAYTRAGHLTRVQDAAGRVVTAATDARGRITELRAPRPDGAPGLQVAVRYEYDEAGDLRAAYDALGQPFRYAYDRHLLVRETDRRGYAFHFRYDGEGAGARCTATWGEDGLFAVRLAYHPDHTVATADDGGTWTYQHDGQGLVTALVDPYGGVTAYTRDAAGRVVREVDPTGGATTFEYDAAGALARRVDSAGFASEVPDADDDDEDDRALPDPDGYTLPSTPRGWEWGATADVPTTWRPTAWFGALLPPEVRAVVALAAAPPAAPPADSVDPLGRVVERRHADGSREAWAYDAEDNVVAYQDRDGGTTRRTYASRNLLVAEADALGHTRRFEYSRTDEITRFVDAGGTGHTFAHDLKDRATAVRTDGGPAEAYEYDAADRLLQRVDAAGRAAVRHEAGPGGLDLRRELVGSETHVFAYDGSGRRVLAEAPGVSATFAYDAEGTPVTDLRGGTGVEHAVDANGELRATTVLGRFAVTYSWDPDDPDVRLVTEPTGAVHRLAVGSGGEVLRRMAGGAGEVGCYDGDGRCVARVAWRDDAAGAPRTRRYAYTPAGDLREVRDGERVAARYEYDAAHRLAREFRADGTAHEYAFDAAGNLLRQPGLAGVLLGPANRLVEAAGALFAYDHRGHLAARRDRTGTTYFRYDALDRLARIETDGSAGREVWEARYDPLGRRVAKTWRGQTTEYWWDDFRLAAERRPDGGVRVYAYADQTALVPLLFVDYADASADPATGRSYYVFADHRGVPTRVEDPAGRVVWAAEVDPFGTARVTVDAGVDMPLRFPGHHFDAETGLHYNRFRYYSPALGRYLQADPLGLAGGDNLYAYPANPLVEVDLDGLKKCGGGKPKKKKPKGKKKAGAAKKGAPAKGKKGGAAGKKKGKGAASKPKKDKHGRLRDANGRYARDPKAKKGGRHSRKTEYPHGNDPAVRQRVIAANTNAKGQVIDPETGKVIPPGQVTIEHKTKVVDHWNKKGRFQSREQRKKFYNDEKNLTVKPKGPNSAEGATCGKTYNQKTGKGYSN